MSETRYLKIPCELGHNLSFATGQCPICALQQRLEAAEKVVEAAGELVRVVKNSRLCSELTDAVCFQLEETDKALAAYDKARGQG